MKFNRLYLCAVLAALSCTQPGTGHELPPADLPTPDSTPSLSPGISPTPEASASVSPGLTASPASTSTPVTPDPAPTSTPAQATPTPDLARTPSPSAPPETPVPVESPTAPGQTATPLPAETPGKPAEGPVYFSEYVEGTGYNKAVEIYNGSDQELRLETAVVRFYMNGSPSPTYSLPLSGKTIQPHGCLVICHPGAKAALLAVSGLTSSDLTFNGDDAIGLAIGGSLVDVIGKIGEDPAAGSWGTEPATTVDHTLRRKQGIDRGDPNGIDNFDPATEWDSYTKDDFSGLGTR
jgi:hypothetical protein